MEMQVNTEVLHYLERMERLGTSTEEPVGVGPSDHTLGLPFASHINSWIYCYTQCPMYYCWTLLSFHFSLLRMM